MCSPSPAKRIVNRRSAASANAAAVVRTSSAESPGCCTRAMGSHPCSYPCREPAKSAVGSERSLLASVNRGGSHPKRGAMWPRSPASRVHRPRASRGSLFRVSRRKTSRPRNRAPRPRARRGRGWPGLRIGAGSCFPTEFLGNPTAPEPSCAKVGSETERGLSPARISHARPRSTDERSVRSAAEAMLAARLARNDEAQQDDELSHGRDLSASGPQQRMRGKGRKPHGNSLIDRSFGIASRGIQLAGRYAGGKISIPWSINSIGITLNWPAAHARRYPGAA